MSHPYPHGQSPFKIKGLAYRGVVRDADERIPGGLNRIAAELGDGELREFLLQPFMASSWSDVLPMLPLVETLSRRFGQSPESYTRDRARAQAAEDLDGVYKVLLKVVSPRIVATRLPRLTASYFNWGKSRGLGARGAPSQSESLADPGATDCVVRSRHAALRPARVDPRWGKVRSIRLRGEPSRRAAAWTTDAKAGLRGDVALI